ncbi:unnamed protein product [Adineta steineri]|uniref:Secreted protein n=2 Tax=Adineta steineri TaxID=433720 RepID=A0A814WQW5_9BILA|nr:unnamed protein product [Adineta steineri]CAF1205578.1 unnamed protein product [Adineta steineri]CAF4088625.1 unnamed protein product [Adineta steineri]
MFRCGHYFVLLMILIEYKNLFYNTEEYRLYSESSGQVCFWQGYAPFCFIGSGCPTRTTNMETSKFGDGAYSWIGVKFYCCL